MREGKKKSRSLSSDSPTNLKELASVSSVLPAPPDPVIPPVSGRLVRAVLYYRVSTDKQDAENQVPELRRYAKFRHWVIAKEYIDQGVSGAKDSRTDLDLMMKEIRAGKYDLLLVYSYDRFARSLPHLVMIMDELGKLGVGFKSLSESDCDTTTAQGRFVFAVYAGLAEWQRHVTAEKTKMTLRRLKDEGVRLGRPTIPEDVKERIYALADQGVSIRRIAAQIQWVRASGEYGTRKVTNLSKSGVAKVLKSRPQNSPPTVAKTLDGVSVG